MIGTADAIARARRALHQIEKKGREAVHTGISEGHASVVSITAGDLRTLLEAAEAAQEIVREGKRQWDQVAAALGVDGDDVDAVLAAAAMEWKPTRWWRAVDAAGEVWCECSDEAQVRASMREGDKLERLYEPVSAEWRAEQ
jgi:hypothetical protein